MGCGLLRCFSSAPFDPWKTNLAARHGSTVRFQKALHFCNFFFFFCRSFIAQLGCAITYGNLLKLIPCRKSPREIPRESGVSKHGGLLPGAKIQLAPNLGGMGSPHGAENEQFPTSWSPRLGVMSSASSPDPAQRGGRGQQDASAAGRRWATKANPPHTPH